MTTRLAIGGVLEGPQRLWGGPFAINEEYLITSPIGYMTTPEGEIAKTASGTYLAKPVGQPGNETWRDFDGDGTTSPHQGCDYGCPCGTALLGPWDATVTFVTWTDGSGWQLRFEYTLDTDGFGGKARVKVAHLWLHLAEAPRVGSRLLKANDRIFQGQQIATSGNTGSLIHSTSTGPCAGGHLHERVDVNGHLWDPLAIYGPEVQYSSSLDAFRDLQEEVNLTYLGVGGRTIRAKRTIDGTEHTLWRPS